MGEGLPSFTLLRAWGSSEPRQELSDSFSDFGLPRDDAAIFSFEGFPSSSAESSFSRQRVLLLARAAAQSLAISIRSNVIPVDTHSLLPSLDARSSTPPPRIGSSAFRHRADLLGRLLLRGSSVVVRSLPSRGRSLPRPSPVGAHAVYRRVGHRLGCVTRGRPAVRLVVSRCLSLFDQSPRASSGVLSFQRLPPSPPRPFRLPFHGQYDSSFLPPQGRVHSIFDPQLRGPGYPSPLRVQRSSSAPPVCAQTARGSGGWPSRGFWPPNPLPFPFVWWEEGGGGSGSLGLWVC